MPDDKQYVLVIMRPNRLAVGPFSSRDDAEYAAMDHYGTAITGASARDEFLIVELRSGDAETIAREHDRHVMAILVHTD